MKWIGWIVFAVVLIVAAFVYQEGARQLEAERDRTDTLLAREREQIEAVFERAAANLPALEKKLAEESDKTAALEARHAKLNAEKTATQSELAELDARAERLRNARSDAANERTENLESIAALQARITKTERQLALLAQALQSVAPLGAGVP